MSALPAGVVASVGPVALTIGTARGWSCATGGRATDRRETGGWDVGAAARARDAAAVEAVPRAMCSTRSHLGTRRDDASLSDGRARRQGHDLIAGAVT